MFETVKTIFDNFKHVGINDNFKHVGINCFKLLVLNRISHVFWPDRAYLLLDGCFSFKMEGLVFI